MALLVNLLGGVGLFLLGMTMLTDGLKLAAGGALERILAAWTRTRIHGLVTGILVTALVQSSTAMTVAVIGFVNAGLLSFSSALWVVFGSNLGSSVTGWLVALIGFKFKIDAFALPFIGIGMAMKLTGDRSRRGALGSALAGFGLLFLGIDLLKDGFGSLGENALPDMGTDVSGMLLAVLVGVLLTIVMQASSATLTVALTAVAGGMLPLSTAAAIVIGANVGTTLTGILAAINATSNARRLAGAHVFFNVVTAVVAFLLLAPMLGLIEYISGRFLGDANPVTQLVVFHSAFNALGVLLMWPLSGPLVKLLQRHFQTAEEDDLRPRYLDMNVASVPDVALQALRREVARMGHEALQLASHATQLHPGGRGADGSWVQAGRKLSHQLAVVEHLQQSIGQFVSQVSRQSMPRQVANQLPHLLRIATHYDTLSRVMYHLGHQASQEAQHQPKSAPAISAALDSGFVNTDPVDVPSCVAPVFISAAAFFEATDPVAALDAIESKLRSSEARAHFEETYQLTKANLLNIAASGEFAVSQVCEWLARLSDLRRAVEQGDKAAQRLADVALVVPQPRKDGGFEPAG